MKSSIKRMTSILTAIFMIIASLFVYSSLIRPVYSEIKNLKAEVGSRLDIINKNKSSISQVQKLLSEYQETVKIQEITLSILPLEYNLSSAVNQIVGLANLNNLSIQSLAVQQLAIKPLTQSNLVKGIGTLRFNIRLSGSYENFKMFLGNLETNVNLMDLVSLKIEQSREIRTDNKSFSFAIIIDTYYQAE